MEADDPLWQQLKGEVESRRRRRREVLLLQFII